MIQYFERAFPLGLHCHFSLLPVRQDSLHSILSLWCVTSKSTPPPPAGAFSIKYFHAFQASCRITPLLSSWFLTYLLLLPLHTWLAIRCPLLPSTLRKWERVKFRWTHSPIPIPFPSQTVIFISSSQVSNMFHPWQFENIWSQSNATFTCSKLNLIDSPTNSYLLKASSIRSWFFRLLNILWFHPGFYIQLLTFSSRRKIENAC